MIISIDVGIKNLSLCKLDSQATIQLWEVIDLSQENHSATCEHIGKKENVNIMQHTPLQINIFL